MRRTTEEILAEHRIRLRSTQLGDHHTTCPQCSHRRRKKSQPCLSVTITAEAVLANCWHCGWKGGWSFDGKTTPQRAAGPARPRQTYADLQRKGWRAWRR